MSLVATLMCRFFTQVSDPLSGFFFVKKDVIKNIRFKTKGYKILLEILAKGKYGKVAEVAFTFRGRSFGASKLGAREVWLFLMDYVKLLT